MTLPDLASQILYGRLGWATVCATVLCALWRGAAPIGRRTLAAIVAASLALMALPGNLSPAWYLGLAFQYPSGLLVGCCVLRLFERWGGIRRSQAMPQSLAGILAVAGTLLYLDAMGLMTRGFYYAGFGGSSTPVVAIVAAGACAFVIVRVQASNAARGPAMAMLGAVALFSVWRLPSGNLWDALLDPLLFGWALIALVAGALRRSSRRASDPALTSEAEAVPGTVLQPVAAERFSSLKEQVGGK